MSEITEILIDKRFDTDEGTIDHLAREMNIIKENPMSCMGLSVLLHCESLTGLELRMPIHLYRMLSYELSGVGGFSVDEL